MIRALRAVGRSLMIAVSLAVLLKGLS